MIKHQFRAWNKYRKIMVYNNEDGGWGNFEGQYCNPVMVVNEELDNDAYIWLQFTGLYDQSQVKIWEGDILDNEEGYIGAVDYERGAYKIISSNRKKFISDYNSINLLDDFKVIGNIYQNPELMRRKQ